LKKTLLITLFGIGAASIMAPAFADVGLFFNNGQGYYGQNYYGLYPFSTLPYYDPYNQPYYSYDPEPAAPYAYKSYHYHPQYTGYSYRQCGKVSHLQPPNSHLHWQRRPSPSLLIKAIQSDSSRTLCQRTVTEGLKLARVLGSEVAIVQRGRQLWLGER
jgi:hypothetical protein